MHVLWLCNIMLPQIAQTLNQLPSAAGGWMAGLCDGLLEHGGIRLTVCFPAYNTNKMRSGHTEKGIGYYWYPISIWDSHHYSKRVEELFIQILKDTRPDAVHIHGTELPHALAMVNAACALQYEEKALISIQGMVSVCAKHFAANLPPRVVYAATLRDILRDKSIHRMRHDFKRRGKYEIEAIKKAKHIIGRTDWDYACTHQINPLAEYHFCNETLRNEFYLHTWKLEKCKRYSIFLSQADYPIKGLHNMLEAFLIIRRFFPQAHLYIAGQNITDVSTINKRIRLSYYGKYIRKLIKKHGLTDHITFTGILNQEQMCRQYLQAHVFVSPSSIENSPNSLGEAMILGVPCVASDVGGVKNLLEHGKEGFVYQADAPYMLAHFVCRLFEDDDIACTFSDQARRHARKTHDKDANTRALINIYQAINDTIKKS